MNTVRTWKARGAMGGVAAGLAAAVLHALLLAALLLDFPADAAEPPLLSGFELVDLPSPPPAPELAEMEPPPPVEPEPEPAEPEPVEPEPAELPPEPEETQVAQAEPVALSSPRPRPRPRIPQPPEPKPQPAVTKPPKPKPERRAPAPEPAIAAAPAYVAPTHKAATLRNPKPGYPLAARRRGLEGRVLLLVEVAEDGRALAVEVDRSSGHGVLDRAARKTVGQWRFVPASRGGRPVRGEVKVAINFELNSN